MIKEPYKKIYVQNQDELFSVSNEMCLKLGAIYKCLGDIQKTYINNVDHLDFINMVDMLAMNIFEERSPKYLIYTINNFI